MADETITEVEARLLAERGRGPFHVTDGLYVWRDSGGIHLAQTDNVHGDALVTHYTFDRSTWASVVAQTAVEGETGTTFRLADALIG